MFADCGVVINPTAAELAEIAIASAESAAPCLKPSRASRCSRSRPREAPRAPLVDKVVEATRTVRARAPDLSIDGELQVDAALVPGVAQSKAPGSPVAGRATR